MSAEEVRRLLPGGLVRPPAAVGDVLRATRERGVRRIAIIDGYFERMAAVWHKEVLVALGKGIAVWGAASMGALRAAELAPFGMIGVGSIYRDYARGVLVADDEVAVAHAPAEYGYAAMSDALVNIRYGLAAAMKRGIVDERARDRLVAVARGMFYRERSWDRVLEEGRGAGVPARMLDALAAWPRPDRKADDARLLLKKLRGDRGVRPEKLVVPRTWALRQLERLL